METSFENHSRQAKELLIAATSFPPAEDKHTKTLSTTTYV